MVSTSVRSNPELVNLRKKIEETKSQMEIEKNNENFKKFDELEVILKNLDKEYAQKKNESDENAAKNPSLITTDTILNIISLKTGIPISKLSADDKKKLVEINDRLKTEVIGQNEAIDTICKALKRGRVGLGTNKCMASFLCVGKTGVGKCVSGDSYITIRNKKTNEIERITINEFKKKFENSPVEPIN